MVIGAEFNLGKCDDFDGIRDHTTSNIITQKKKDFAASTLRSSNRSQ
jgi:hypothetical protein